MITHLKACIMQESSIDKLITQAKKALSESEIILQGLLAIDDDIDDDGDSEDKIHAMQLLLQYRLNAENALAIILKMDQHLLAFLGVQPQHSPSMNIDRMGYTLGREELKQLLSILAMLQGFLSKVTAQIHGPHARFSIKLKHQDSLLVKELQQVAHHFNRFLHVLPKIEIELKQLIKLEAIGPVFDHICALRGPISQFHHAIIIGLGLVETCYNKISKDKVLEHQMGKTLKQVEHLLMPPKPAFKPIQPTLENATTNEQLEQRAQAKRLRPFFGYTPY
jgi:hypothetical protein